MRLEWQDAARRQREQVRERAADALAGDEDDSSLVVLHAATLPEQPVGTQRYSFYFRGLLRRAAGGGAADAVGSEDAGEVGSGYRSISTSRASVAWGRSSARDAPLCISVG